MHATPLVPLALIGWIPLALVVFSMTTPRRAILFIYIAGVSLLPTWGYRLSGLPDYDKSFAISFSALLGVLIFDSPTLLAFRPRWYDIPIAIWSLSPLTASLTNGLGIYDGLSSAMSQTLSWGLPYLMGRLYFRDVTAMRELALAIVVGALIYVPLCLFEVRMSPQLNKMIYGFRFGGFFETYRLGGWRPQVFMQHGLALGMWMCMAALIALWLWRSNVRPKLLSMPMTIAAGVVAVTAVLCKSLGAILLLVAGAMLMWASVKLRTKTLLLACAIAPMFYFSVRGTGIWDGQALVDMARAISPLRAESLNTRITMENKLAAKANQRALFGWGGWGRHRVVDEFTGRDQSLTDGLWIIAFGMNGLVGLAGVALSQAIPPLLFLQRCPPRMWAEPPAAPAAAIMIVIVMVALDNVLNAMINPVFVLMLGSLASFSEDIRPAPRVT